ncbi:MAG: DMT family transporter [Acidobacteriota bacterium]
MTNSRQADSFPPVIYVLIAVLIWSTGGLFIKLTTLDAYQVTFFRSLLAGITVAILTRKHGLKIDAFGVLTSIIYATLLFLFVWATKHTTAANAIFLQYTAPIYILILAPFIIGEKFHWRDLITVAFCIGGMSLFFVGKLEITDYQGNIAALFSGVFLGLYIMLLKHPRAGGRPETRDRRQESEPGAVATGLPASAVNLYEGGDPNPSSQPSPVSRLSSPVSSMNPAIAVIYGNFLLAFLTLPSGIAALPVMNLTDIGSVTFLGIVQIGIAYILFIRGVTGGTRPLDASIIGFIEPLLNPVWVFLFIGERPSTWAIFGGTIIIATVITHTLVQYKIKVRLP